jgi:hypothetical protein
MAIHCGKVTIDGGVHIATVTGEGGPAPWEATLRQPVEQLQRAGGRNARPVLVTHASMSES